MAGATKTQKLVRMLQVLWRSVVGANGDRGDHLNSLQLGDYTEPLAAKIGRQVGAPRRDRLAPQDSWLNTFRITLTLENRIRDPLQFVKLCPEPRSLLADQIFAEVKFSEQRRLFLLHERNLAV
jgi:hypothetical protein